MTNDAPGSQEAPKLRCLPAQIVSIPNGVIIVRGCTEVKIGGERAAEVVQTIVAATSTTGATRSQIIEMFAGPDRPAVDELVGHLIAKRLLATSEESGPPADRPETNDEIFYWHFGEKAEIVLERLASKHIVIMGVNAISRHLLGALRAAGAGRVEVVDYHMLRNLRFYDDAGFLQPAQWAGWLEPPLAYDEWSAGLDPDSIDCLVATSDCGGWQLMREWNEWSVANRRQFLPVVLDRMIGFVGPLVIPGETPCYECARARENANMDDPDSQRATEPHAPMRQSVIGFHPSMANIAADVAAMELTKFYSGALPSRVGRLIEVNLLATTMRARKLLKLPRCPVCSPAVRRSAANATRNDFVPGHQLNYHELG